MNLDSLAFVTEKKYSANIVKKIFVDTYGTKWHYRYSVTIPYSDLVAFFSDPDPYLKVSSREGTVELRISRKQWRKNSEINSRVFTLIGYN
jgi:hypothetical protein